MVADGESNWCTGRDTCEVLAGGVFRHKSMQAATAGEGRNPHLLGAIN